MLHISVADTATMLQVSVADAQATLQVSVAEKQAALQVSVAEKQATLLFSVAFLATNTATTLLTGNLVSISCTVPSQKILALQFLGVLSHIELSNQELLVQKHATFDQTIKPFLSTCNTNQ